MITYLVFLITTWFTVWLNAKFINDSKGTDQYWHIVQFMQQAWIWCAFGIFVFINNGDICNYIIRAACYGAMYMLIYNSSLNALRKLNISHLGRYDFVSFRVTVVLFILGFIGAGINEYLLL
jgi:hypothetical protein